MTRPFVIDLGWDTLLADLGVRPADLLRAANLPEDLLSRPRPTLPAGDFARLFETLAAAIGGTTPGLVLGQAMSPEVFSPPLFAAYCSADMETAAGRLAHYKPLIGPLSLNVRMSDQGLDLILGAEPGVGLPTEYAAAELVFLVNLARQATRSAILPLEVEMASPPAAPGYAEFFGQAPRRGDANRIRLSREDARRPFKSANPALFAVFDPDLRARLDELARDARTVDRMRSVLMEALPGGQPEMAAVARRLGMSTRTLQRRLGAEGTGFQEELRALRERLARDYLSKTLHTSAEISFLLGYEDPNSFIRAFHGWTGTTPEALRAGAR